MFFMRLFAVTGQNMRFFGFKQPEARFLKTVAPKPRLDSEGTFGILQYGLSYPPTYYNRT
jgi:hypothetical protein